MSRRRASPMNLARTMDNQSGQRALSVDDKSIASKRGHVSMKRNSNITHNMKCKIKRVIICALALIFLLVACTESSIGLSYDTIVLRFLGKDEAADFLSESDNHSQNLSKLNFNLILGDENATEEDYLCFAASQALDWTDEEKAYLAVVANELNVIIREKGLRLNLPESISLIKTTGKEDGGSAGYTRGTAIVLNEVVFSDTDYPGYLMDLMDLVAHEIFHVLTRNNPILRSKLYSLIGFTVLPESIDIPQEVLDYVIENPDVNAHDSYAYFTTKDDGERPFAMLLYYDGEVEPGGGLTSAMLTGSLIEIDPETKKAVQRDDGSWMYSMSDVTDFFYKVGCNTNYIIDPEEILADNFAYMLLIQDYSTMPTPELLEELEAALK